MAKHRIEHEGAKHALERMTQRDAKQLARTPRTARQLVRAYTLHRAGQVYEALPLYAEVLKAEPGNPVALHYAALLGRTLRDHVRTAKGDAAPSVLAADDALLELMAYSVVHAPTNVAAVFNLAKFHHDRGNLAMARDLYENVVKMDGSMCEAWMNLGEVYGDLGNATRMDAAYIRALEEDKPGAPGDTRWNMSFLKLRKGLWPEGWDYFEARWESVDFLLNYQRDDLPWRRWDGQRTTRPVYVHQEQGAGDALMMARYLPLVEQASGHAPIVEVNAPLVRLFQAMFPGYTVVARFDALPDAATVSRAVPMMSLPALFRTSLDTVPVTPYFWPMQANGHRIEAIPGKIGLCWRGSTTHHRDRFRSLSFADVLPLLDVSGVTWQSLQYGYETVAPLAPLPAGDFLETARVLATCALVVTVDTSIAHLAGVLRVPTWILLPWSAEWRWLEKRQDTPWWPMALLLRQDAARDWRTLIGRVGRALTSMWGEPPQHFDVIARMP